MFVRPSTAGRGGPAPPTWLLRMPGRDARMHLADGGLRPLLRRAQDLHLPIGPSVRGGLRTIPAPARPVSRGPPLMGRRKRARTSGSDDDPPCPLSRRAAAKIFGAVLVLLPGDDVPRELRRARPTRRARRRGWPRKRARSRRGSRRHRDAASRRSERGSRDAGQVVEGRSGLDQQGVGTRLAEEATVRRSRNGTRSAALIGAGGGVVREVRSISVRRSSSRWRSRGDIGWPCPGM